MTSVASCAVFHCYSRFFLLTFFFHQSPPPRNGGPPASSSDAPFAPGARVPRNLRRVAHKVFHALLRRRPLSGLRNLVAHQTSMMRQCGLAGWLVATFFSRDMWFILVQSSVWIPLYPCTAAWFFSRSFPKIDCFLSCAQKNLWWFTNDL